MSAERAALAARLGGQRGARQVVGRVLVRTGDGDHVVGADGSVDIEGSLFALVGPLPGGALLTIGAIILIGIFFVTSADSGALVMGPPIAQFGKECSQAQLELSQWFQGRMQQGVQVQAQGDRLLLAWTVPRPGRLLLVPDGGAAR